MSSTEPENITPQSLITEEHVDKALKSDKGSDALMKSWKVVDFTKPGDNYACIVTSVEVKYSLNDQDCEVSYVVKLNSLKDFAGLTDFAPVIFEKEGTFYMDILPTLNKELIAAGQPTLRLPKCFHVSLEYKKEQLYFEDLRVKGYKMFDRRKGMDKDHSSLVLAELARLHSASYLLMSKLEEGETATTRYEILSKDLFNLTPDTKKMMVPMFQQQIDTGVMMLEKVGGYETSIDWLRSLVEDVEYLLTQGTKSKKFNTICHGDCWNNNLLFRYDDDNHPVEVTFVDLQICCEASISQDLNYFLYSSVSGDVRIPHLDHFMSTYHSNYERVLKGGGLEMYFDKHELLEEYRAKNKIGAFYAMGFIPIILMRPEEVPEFSNTDIDTVALRLREIALDKLRENPLCKPRFLSIFDELMEIGIIPK